MLTVLFGLFALTQGRELLAKGGVIKTLESNIIRPSIVNGEKAVPGRYPWYISVRNQVRKKTYVCGGTLILPNVVLTAGHCIESQVGYIYANRDNLTNVANYDRDYQTIDWKKAIVHPQYSGKVVQNDVALIILQDSVPSAQLCQLPPKSITPGQEYHLIGFGLLASGGSSISPTLQETTVDGVSISYCRSVYGKKRIRTGMGCAYGENHGSATDSCQGDSGGPMFVKGAVQSQDAIYGITSWGAGCALQDVPGVYTDVRTYLDWITSTLRSEGLDTTRLRYATA